VCSVSKFSFHKLTPGCLVNYIQVYLDFDDKQMHEWQGAAKYRHGHAFVLTFF